MTMILAFVYTILGENLDLDQLNDINNHGMSGGVSGFIYSSELYDKFKQYEDEIMDTLDEFCNDVFNQSAECYIAERLSQDDRHWTLQQFREFAVWMYVELKAQEIIESN